MSDPLLESKKTSANVDINRTKPWRCFYKTIKILLNIVSSLLVGGLIAFALANHAVLHVIEIESKGMTRLMEQYNEVDAVEDDNLELGKKQLADFQQYFYFSPESDSGVGWIVLDALTQRIHGPKASEPVVRQALNRLQGWELNFFLTTLDNRIKGYRHDNYKDPLENEDLPTELREGLLTMKDIYTFSDKEIEALKACEQSLSAQESKYEWMSGYQSIAEMIYPGSLFDSCSLTGKIDL